MSVLCSDCSRTVRPVVAIDIDGTLGDYHDHFLNFADGYLDQEFTSTPEMYELRYGGSRPFRDWFCKVYGVDVSTFRAIKLAYRQGAMKRTMPVYPGASELILTLVNEGIEVWLTTTRPFERYDRVDPDTRAWLSRNHITFNGLVHDEDKYAMLAEHVDRRRVVGVLDDLPEQLRDAEVEFPNARLLQRRTDWNQWSDWDGAVVETLHAAGAMLKTDANRIWGRISRDL